MKAERFQARIDLAAVVSIGALALALGACGDEQPGSAAEGVARPAVHLTHVTDKRFERARFSNPTKIDNRWFPLPAGMQFIYHGRSDRGQGRLPHRVIFTATDL